MIEKVFPVILTLKQNTIDVDILAEFTGLRNHFH